MEALGRHILVEFHECGEAILGDTELLKTEMERAARAAGATVVTSSFHTFNPCGVSGVVIIAESHLTIHTWPEFRYAAVDFFTCGSSVDPWVAVAHLGNALAAGHRTTLEVKRGERAGNGELRPARK